METLDHQSLKRLAAAWLQTQRAVAVAIEVRCPISRYRVDVGGYLDPVPAVAGSREPALPGVPPIGHTTFIECKASRADFLRDTRDRERLLAARERLNRELAHVDEEFVKRGEPHLRDSGNFLFGDMERWALERSASPARRAVVRELRRVDGAIHGGTKFFMLAHYRLADRLLILAPPGLVEPRELPRAWGLLSGDPQGSALARVVVDPLPLDARPIRRMRALRNIAAAATRAALAAVASSVPHPPSGECR